MEKEIWKDIPNYEGFYQASNLGRIRSLNRYGIYNKFYKGQILKQRNTRGYLQVNLSKNGKHKTHRVHRLIISSFFGISKLQINHKNGIKSDNRLENLEYCTCSENIKHAYSLGLRNSYGEKSPNHKLTEHNIIKMKEMYKTGEYFQKTLAKLFNISQTHVSLIVNNCTWKYLNKK